MVTYVILCRLTQQGIGDIKNSADRIQANVERARQAGLIVKGVYLTMGEYDQVLIIDAPDDETMAAGLLMLGQQGYVRTTALRAFDAEAAARIIGKLP
ncbi:MAG: GYD domain-containing protein [Chloroflexi bacterium]|nr:GYD domain-containing protein [Chloroflexota bacterium]